MCVCVWVGVTGRDGLAFDLGHVKKMIVKPDKVLCCRIYLCSLFYCAFNTTDWGTNQFWFVIHAYSMYRQYRYLSSAEIWRFVIEIQRVRCSLRWRPNGLSHNLFLFPNVRLCDGPQGRLRRKLRSAVALHIIMRLHSHRSVEYRNPRDYFKPLQRRDFFLV